MTKLNIPRTYDHRLKVYERPDRPGAWIVDYFLPPQRGEEIVRQRLKVPGRNKEQRDGWIARKRVALDRLEFDGDDLRKMGVDPHEHSDDPTLGEFFTEFRKFREFGRKRPLSPRTIDSQEKIIERFFQTPIGEMKHALADHRLSEFTRGFIQDFTADLQRVISEDSRNDSDGHLSAKYLNNVTGVLGRILTVAEDRGKIERRPRVDKLPVDGMSRMLIP